MILKWRILSATNDLDRVSAVALPKLPISLTNTDLKVASDTQFYPGLGKTPEMPASRCPWGWDETPSPDPKCPPPVPQKQGGTAFGASARSRPPLIVRKVRNL